MPGKTPELVSTVVINYNNAATIGVCLESILTSEPTKPHQLIVVDDASTDDSLAEISRFKGLKLIQNSENRGPVFSRNRGAKHATAPYLLFLDSDARIEPNYISTLASHLNIDDQAGVVSGKVIEESTGERMWYNFGYDPSPLRDGIAEIFHKLALGSWHSSGRKGLISRLSQPFTKNLMRDKVMIVDWVVEMGFITRRHLFTFLGGLDERFFMFFEGPDYCRRVRAANYDVIYTPHASLTHLGRHSHSNEQRAQFFKDSLEHYFSKYPPSKLDRLGFDLWVAHK